MADRFADYHEAVVTAQARANSTGLDIAIRRTREFGRDGFNVSFAARNDSDYALAEIVTPEVDHSRRHRPRGTRIGWQAAGAGFDTWEEYDGDV